MSPAARTATGGVEERTLLQWGELAEQSVRELNHRTRPALGELTDPAEMADLVAVLAAVAGMLPQLLDQLAAWLDDQHRHRRLRVDTRAAHGDVDQTVHATVAALAHAGECTRRAGCLLEGAHQHATHLATTDSDSDGWGER